MHTHIPKKQKGGISFLQLKNSVASFLGFLNLQNPSLSTRISGSETRLPCHEATVAALHDRFHEDLCYTDFSTVAYTHFGISVGPKNKPVSSRKSWNKNDT